MTELENDRLTHTRSGPMTARKSRVGLRPRHSPKSFQIAVNHSKPWVPVLILTIIQI